MSEVLIFHHPDARPQEWRVEEIDSDGDGGIDMAIFSGPHAEQRAKRFAERLRDEASLRAATALLAVQRKLEQRRVTNMRQWVGQPPRCGI